ncbi:MAG: SO_0444 family Cu/Zn efflux transporter [Deltaproteobacteria bacterium]|nr:SO_0444 family Cu/Zn efflux transporter [Deltaproteobacteria bacterium]
MTTFTTHFFGIAGAAWELLVSAGIYILLGLVVAALLHAFVRRETIARYLGQRNFRSVLYAALAGIPLPLCSCGVLPAAMGLRKDGASKGATLAFLISTPETGVDSIAVTYALIDPLMAAIRPVAAFTTAFVAGALEVVLNHDSGAPSGNHTATAACCHADAGPSHHALPTPHAASSTSPGSPLARLRIGFHYAFVELLADITPTFLLGIGLGGVIAHVIPTTFIETYLGHGLPAMLVMLAVGIPLYICAAASTPIAAALIMKGMSPGVALVFLLAGPATNITALPVVAKMLGWRSVGVYLLTIAVAAVGFGLLTDLLYGIGGVPLRVGLSPHEHPVALGLRTASALALLGTMLHATLRQRRPTR